LTIPANALVVLCGPAASGKSEFAESRFLETQIVSSDRCRALVSDDETDITVSAHAFDLLYFTIDKRLALGRLTVADSTALGADARNRLRKIARGRGVPLHIILFDVPVECLIDRDSARERTGGERVIRSHAEKFAMALENIAREDFDAVWRLDEKTSRNALVEITGPGESVT